MKALRQPDKRWSLKIDAFPKKTKADQRSVLSKEHGIMIECSDKPPPPPSTTMGGRVSMVDKAAKARSDEIDRQLNEDRKRFNREIKILVLGP